MQLQQLFQLVLTYAQSLLIYINHWVGSSDCLILASIFLLILIILKLKPSPKKKFIKERSELIAIAGEDMIATQLDLARAYIEMNEKKLAKKLLHEILKEGDSKQKQEAKYLLDICR